MMPMSLGEVAQATGGHLLAEPEASGSASGSSLQVTSVATDTGQVQAGTLFVAIAGERVDGHDFLTVAAEAGACAALVAHPVEGVSLPQIVVDDTVAALGRLAAHNLERRRELSTPFTVIGITGSVGKTTTKDLLAALLRELGPTVAPVGSFNNEIGLPLTALGVGESTRYLIAEMGASRVGDIAYLTSIVPLDIAIELKVGVAHLGVFGSVERIAQAKSELVQGLRPQGVSVLNADDERVAAMAKLAPGRVLWFGLGQVQGAVKQDELDMGAANICTDSLDHPHFTLQARGEQPLEMELGLSGIHNVINALAAASVAHELGLPTERIGQVLAQQGHISPHRMALSQVEREGSSFTLIDDSFNANPDSMRAGLHALSTWGADEQTQPASKPYRIAVLGGMLELGEQTLDMHRTIGEYCARLGLDALIAVGGSGNDLSAMAGAMVEGASAYSAEQEQAQSTLVVYKAVDTQEADQIVIELTGQHPGSVVLLKGSHSSGLSDLAERWQGERLGVAR
ncbi:UDP-N-acetylmuramoyl-tripeptide--D-alanyl-D-alanine ligase [Bombiscardovia apis]|nr:UDP-N-acetylmuramoyl-tripeptide--D-alanyl-D-alanine ligase [Bombiscardovia apis]